MGMLEVFFFLTGFRALVLPETGFEMTRLHGSRVAP